MPVAAADLEPIVQEVLRRLRAMQGSPTIAATPAPLAPSANGSPATSEAAQTLMLSQRIVTLAALDGQLERIRQVIVPRDAVITPAVRDELRQRRIALTWQCAASSGGGLARLLVGAASLDCDAKGLLRVVEQAAEVELTQANCLPTMITRLSESIALQKQLALLLTDQTAAALCLANRHCAVRAALGCNVGSVSQAVKTIGANLLVVDSAATTPFELRGMIKEFTNGGFRECPAPYHACLQTVSSS